MTLNFGIGQSELPWGDTFTATGADVTRICTEVKELGATSIRMSALWIQLDPGRNRKYKWANLDRAVDAAEAAGLDILLIIEPRRSVLPIGVQASSAMAVSYGKFCGDIAARYTGRIRWYEIGNEVNNFAFFGGAKSPSKYVEFLREANENIKANDPLAEVLAGALQAVGTGWPTLHPVEWVTYFYRTSPQDHFDGLSMHPYSTDGVFNPMAPTADNEFAFRNIDEIRALMDANGDSGKLIYTTEWGYDSMRTLNGLSSTDLALEEEQALHIETHWNILEGYADAGIIYPTTWIFMYRDWEQENRKAQHHFGITHFDYTKKPAWFTVRSFVVDQNVAPPTVVSTAQAWAPEVEAFVDPSNLKPPSVAITAQAWEPTIDRPLQLVAATATAEAHAPLVDSEIGVRYVSTGEGDRDDVTNDASVTIQWTHDVTDAAGRLLLVALVTSHSLHRAWESYDTLAVSSDLGGAFTRLASRHIASSSDREGSVHLFGLYQAPVGTHTITAQVVEVGINFSAVTGNSVLYRGVAGPGAVTAKGSSTGGNSPEIDVVSTPGNMVVSAWGGSTQFNDFTGNTRVSTGSTVDGNGDWIFVGDKDGASSVNLDFSNGLMLYGTVALDLKQITTERLISTSTATATAQAQIPVVQASGVVLPPVATATATTLIPAVLRLVQAPVVTATATAHAPTVQTPGVLPPTATATAMAHATTISRPVELDATSTGVRDVSQDGTAQLSITVGSDPNTRLYVALVVSTSAATDKAAYDTLTVSSDVSGSIALLLSEDIGGGSEDRGTVFLFEHTSPAAGAHTITIQVAEASTDITSLMAQALSYSYVGGTSGGATRSQFSSALDLPVSSAHGNKVLFVGGWSGTPSNFSGGTVRYSDGGSVTGTGDFIRVADADGAATVTWTADSGPRVGAVAIDLDHA